MFVLQSKDALVVTKTGREVKRTGNLKKKNDPEQVRGQEPKSYRTSLCLVWHTRLSTSKYEIFSIPFFSVDW